MIFQRIKVLKDQKKTLLPLAFSWRKVFNACNKGIQATKARYPVGKLWIKGKESPSNRPLRDVFCQREKFFSSRKIFFPKNNKAPDQMPRKTILVQ